MENDLERERLQAAYRTLRNNSIAAAKHESEEDENEEENHEKDSENEEKSSDETIHDQKETEKSRKTKHGDSEVNGRSKRRGGKWKVLKLARKIKSKKSNSKTEDVDTNSYPSRSPSPHKSPFRPHRQAKDLWKNAIRSSKAGFQFSRMAHSNSSGLIGRRGSRHKLEPLENRRDSKSLILLSEDDRDKLNKYTRLLPRQLSRKNLITGGAPSTTKLTLNDSGGLGLKNVFQRTAKLALQQSKDPESDGDSDEDSAALAAEERRLEAERADNILRGVEGDDFASKYRWNRTWRTTLNKLEMVLPAIVSTNDNRHMSEKDRKMKEALENIKHEMEGYSMDTIQPTVSGLKHFGIAKTGITRAVVNFVRPPRPHPLTCCFHFPQNFLNHKYVSHMVLGRLKLIPGARVVTVQFQDRNVFHGTRNFDNRWIVRVAPVEAYDTLLTYGIEICNRRVTIRSYDDVLKDEYEEYKEYVRMQKKFMYDKIQDLTGEMPSQALSIIKEVTADMLPDPDNVNIPPHEGATSTASFVRDEDLFSDEDDDNEDSKQAVEEDSGVEGSLGGSAAEIQAVAEGNGLTMQPSQIMTMSESSHRLSQSNANVSQSDSKILDSSKTVSQTNDKKCHSNSKLSERNDSLQLSNNKIDNLQNMPQTTE